MTDDSRYADNPPGAGMGLSPEHRRELFRDSAIDVEVARERGYTTVERIETPTPPAERLKAMGFPGWAVREPYFYPGLHIPQYTPSGRRYAGQWKPRNPVPNAQGKKMRYASARGSAHLDVHPRWSLGHELLPPILDPSRRLWITEGVKKADALTSRGEVTVALAGVYNWRSAHGTLGDWEDVALRGREIIICFDADARTKAPVAEAMARLGKWLGHKGAAKVWYLAVPPSVGDTVTKGVDDYLAAGGTLKGLEQAFDRRPPEVPSAEDPFTDSALADLVAAEVLEGSWCKTEGLGWLRYDGRLWVSAAPGEALEAVRQYTRQQYAEALHDASVAVSEGRVARPGWVDGWHKVQSKSRLEAILGLAGNIEGVWASAGSFDTDPDLLNTPSGVVDLRTGDLGEHDPALMFTKITKARYVPGAESPAFKQALLAVPEEAQHWLQRFLGQAVTGHSASAMLLADGGGHNGKTAFMGALFAALGGGPGNTGYAAKIPNTLLLKGTARSGPTPERMTLRGTRLAYMEETPESGHLDAQTAKDLIDAQIMEGRHLFKNITEWVPSHGIVLNTNHAPSVGETDDGTWRRLLRLTFPHRFRTPGDGLGDPRPEDVPGDGRLKEALGTAEAMEAFLAWAVAGAAAWYAEGPMEPPAVMVAARQKWREDSDDVLRFLGVACTVSPDVWCVSSELYQTYKRWAETGGHRPMSSKEWVKRLAGHGALPAYVEAKKIGSSTAGGTRGPGYAVQPLGETCNATLGIGFCL